MGTHMIVLIKGIPMHTNMAGFERFSKFSRSCAFDERVNANNITRI